MNKWYKKAKESDPEYQKMVKFFKERTKKHINRVKKYCKKVYKLDEERFKEILKRADTHDQSKYNNPEIDPYIYLTWRYKCEAEGKKFECPEGMDDKIHEATEHHVTHNKHHPEYHTDDQSSIINKKDRDKPPEKPVDAKEMGDIDIAEMVSDWCAMSEEKGGSPKDWADKNVNVRWLFTDSQKDLIYYLISEIWKD